MQTCRSLILLATVGAVQIGAMVFSGAIAKDARLTPEQISAFNAKVDQARATQKTVGGRETCLNVYIGDLQAKNSDREKDLGDTLRRESDLTASLTRLEDEQKGFSATVTDEQRNLQDKQQVFQSAMNDQRAQDSRLRDCKRAMTFLSGLCDVGDKAVRELGLMRNVQAEMAGIQARLASAQTGLNDAQRRLADNQNALAQARDQASSQRAAIQQIEGEIVRVKSTIADLHTTIEVYNNLLEDMTSLMDDVDSIDAESPRAAQIVRLSSEVEDITSRAPAVIDLANSALPEGMRQNCSPR